MRKTTQLVGAVVFSLLSLNASASIITFNDRTAFENYVGSYTLDDLNTDAALDPGADLSNSDYSWSMSDYACVDSSGCDLYTSINPFVNGSNDWVWTYGSGNFEMSFGVTAFGLDYADPYDSNTAQIGLHGFNSGINSNGSFFGIATDDGSKLTSISYQQYSAYQSFDNVIYSSRPSENNNLTTVPEPATLALFGLGLAAFGIAKRKV